MRRPRSKLEVSTFPFLAVLLCAMGSLMLFLFIMDRRAKIVERNRALAARESYAASRLAQTQAERDARKAEWEKAQDKLRGLLLEQQQQLLAQSEGIQKELTNANQKLQVVRSQYLSAQEAIQGETGRIFLLQSEVDKERDSVKKVKKKEAANKAELAKATQELLELTAALELLKTQKSQEKDVYSVVPYRGKRGDMRPPIYVECVHNGLVFHPAKKLLRTGSFTAQALITEVERFAGPLAAEKSTKQRDIIPEPEKKGPYVLFLVRPDGIANYYRAQAALRGVDIDYGYELVDEQWVLDFSSAVAPNLPDSAPAPYPPAQPGIRGPGLRGRFGGVAGNGNGADVPSSLVTGRPNGATGPGANGPTSPNPNRLSGVPGGNGLGAPYASGNQYAGAGFGGSGSGSSSGIGAPNGMVPAGIGGGSAWPSANGSNGTGFGPGGTGTGSNSTWPSANGSQGTGFGPTNGASGSTWPPVGGSQGTGFGPGGTGTAGNSTWPSANGSQGTGFGPGGASSGASGSTWPSANGSQGTGFGPGGATSGAGGSTWPSANGSQGTGFGPGGATSGASGFVGSAQGTGFGSAGSGGLPSPFAGGSPGTAGPNGMGLASSFTPVTPMGSGGGGGGGLSVPGSAGLGSPYSGPGSPASPGMAGLTPQDPSVVVGFGPPGSPVTTSSLRPDVIASSGSSGATRGGSYAPGPGGTNGSPGVTGGGSFSPGAIGAYGASGAGGSPFSPGGSGGSGASGDGSGGASGPPGDAGAVAAGSSGNQNASGAPSSGGGGIPSFSFGGSPSQGGGGGPQNINPNVTPDQSAGGNSAGQAGQSAGISIGSASGQGSSGGSSGGPSLPSAPLPAAFNTTPTKTTAPAPPTLSRVLGNKDFQITIDCYVDHVNVYPGGMQFRWTPQNQEAMDQTLVQSVTRLIERRQASVRPGEPPYRPLVRFQVLPDGLRSYYHVYPLLERLRIPMTRENVEE